MADAPLRPRDRLDSLLKILLGAADIAQRGVERIVAHDLCEAMEWDDARHLIAEPMPQIVRGDVGDTRPLCSGWPI